MIEKGLVSVVIPCYNTARFIKKTIESVLQQTYPHIEIIIVDDGSDDETPSILKSFNNNPKVKTIRQVNSGAASARNRGISMATGPFIAFLDSDDLWLPNKLELQISLFQNPDVHIVYSDRENIDESDNKISCRKLTHYRGRKLSGQLLFENFIPMSSAIIRKEVFQKVKSFDITLSRSEDIDFWLKASVYFGIDYVDKALVLHRLRDDQLTQNKAKCIESSLEIQRRFIKKYENVVTQKAIRRGWAVKYTRRGIQYAKDKKTIYAVKDLLYAMVQDITYVLALKALVKIILRRKDI